MSEYQDKLSSIYRRIEEIAAIFSRETGDGGICARAVIDGPDQNTFHFFLAELKDKWRSGACFDLPISSLDLNPEEAYAQYVLYEETVRKERGKMRRKLIKENEKFEKSAVGQEYFKRKELIKTL